MRSSTFFAATLALCAAAHASAQQKCVDTAEGRICTVSQAITTGTPVSVETQRALGLVSVGGGCSGTLLNRYWVLTARHCTTVGGTIGGVLRPAAQVPVTATWAPGLTALPSRLHELAPNVGVTPATDMILIYLGNGDLGDAPGQRLSITQRGPTTVARWVGRRLQPTDTVTQYGSGFSTFASGVFGTPSAIPATGLGTYRSAQFRPVSISATSYSLAMNGASQVGHGGDSGGPTWLTEGGVGVGINGVQSTCRSTGSIPGAPPGWMWATGISACFYVSVEPMVREIGRTIAENPECKDGAACALPAIDYLLRD